MKQNNKNNKTNRAPTLLLVFSLMTMGISLFSISFITYTEPYSGFMTLGVGLIFGWIAPPGGLAVYANLFYFYALLKSASKKPPTVAAIIMLVLASLTFTFDCVPHGAGCSSVYAWGWGAVFWMLSILALTFVVFISDTNVKTEVSVIVFLLLTILLPVCLYRTYQYQQANAQERERYLPPSVAFTTVEFGGVPYNPPQKNVTFNQNTVLAIEGDIDIMRLRTIDKNFSVRLPNLFQHSDTFWRVYPRAVSPQFRYMDGYVALLDEPKTVDYHYGIRQISSQRGEIFITDANNNTVWQTEIAKKNDKYYPDYGSDFFDLFRPLLTGNSNPNYIYWQGNDHQKKQFNEITSKHCPFIKEKNSDSINIKWNGQRIQLDNNYGEIQSEAFCSENYAFLLLVKESSRKKELPSLNVIVFEKQTMLPLWHFSGYSRSKQSENKALTKLLAYYKAHKSLNNEIQQIELIPHVPNTSKTGKQNWQPVKVAIHTNNGTAVIMRDNFF